ncbi:gluconate 2-dehydrogenase subunit 3 family protein [Fodinibius sediminis]|uniref:Gluconate 2-dehydrogenase subunit 3 n=1 Tax=Fodinibius sediminis TaxID=1214077 RepID=A0A521AVB1_9BACT|nr:gluconate 2-dehydrogenase subunit 3 family protein [Fodinibius sediminis]SMO38792.1 Gluconate 2-dehydrogenase subunit 3 [Fodinibius sediminis]
MDRKEALKALGLTTIGSGLLLEACTQKSEDPSPVVDKDNLDGITGRQDFEIERLKRLREAPPFFTEHEMLTITALADIIIPEDEVSGSASDANVPEFIAFIVKDMPEHQLPMRGGLKWLDTQCLKRYEGLFIECTENQQLEMVEAIAYPTEAAPEMQPGVTFFNRMRNLTASGFYTTEMGIEDIGYKGNTPNNWEGVPEEVLAEYDLERS